MRGLLTIVAVCLSAALAAAQSFHTDPSCWESPRMYHTGAPSAELARRIERTPRVTRQPRDSAVVAPNGAYKAWVEIPNAPVGNVADQILYVYSEQDRVTRFYIERAQLEVAPQWVNEKLLFVRVVWGREVFTDLLIDAESGDILYQEEARAGRNAFEQYKEACGNTCPCDPRALTEVTPPDSVPGAGEGIGVVALPGLLHQGNYDEPRDPRGREALRVYGEIDGRRVETGRIEDPAEIESMESGYEVEAAVVYAKEPGWYLIGLAGGARTAWVREETAGDYTRMADLLISHLAYLDEDWDGRVWVDPSGEGGYAVSRVKDPGREREEYAAEFLEWSETDSGLWMRVRVHDTSGCVRSDETVVDEGWVPAWSAAGKLTGGFYSRGC